MEHENLRFCFMAEIYSPNILQPRINTEQLDASVV